MFKLLSLGVSTEFIDLRLLLFLESSGRLSIVEGLKILDLICLLKLMSENQMEIYLTLIKYTKIFTEKI